MPIHNTPGSFALELQSLDPPKKPLPLTPPEFYRVSVLEYENKMLKRDNGELQAQVQLLSRQVQHYQQVSEAARVFVKTTSASVRRLQDATTRMKEVEAVAKKEWDKFCEEEQVSRNERESHLEEGRFI